MISMLTKLVSSAHGRDALFRQAGHYVTLARIEARDAAVHVQRRIVYVIAASVLAGVTLVMFGVGVMLYAFLVTSGVPLVGNAAHVLWAAPAIATLLTAIFVGLATHDAQAAPFDELRRQFEQDARLLRTTTPSTDDDTAVSTT